MPASLDAFLFLVLVGKAFRMAHNFNELGAYWPGFVSGLVGLFTVGAGEFSLARTQIGEAVVVLGILIALRIGLEVGFSVGMLCPNQAARPNRHD
jgi:hypothetical protein